MAELSDVDFEKLAIKSHEKFPFARQDIQFTGRLDSETIDQIDYLVIKTNLNLDLDYEQLYPNLKQVYAVERSGIPLTKVYKIID